MLREKQRRQFGKDAARLGLREAFAASSAASEVAARGPQRGVAGPWCDGALPTPVAFQATIGLRSTALTPRNSCVQGFGRWSRSTTRA